MKKHNKQNISKLVEAKGLISYETLSTMVNISFNEAKRLKRDGYVQNLKIEASTRAQQNRHKKQLIKLKTDRLVDKQYGLTDLIGQLYISVPKSHYNVDVEYVSYTLVEGNVVLEVEIPFYSKNVTETEQSRLKVEDQRLTNLTYEQLSNYIEDLSKLGIENKVIDRQNKTNVHYNISYFEQQGLESLVDITEVVTYNTGVELDNLMGYDLKPIVTALKHYIKDSIENYEDLEINKNYNDFYYEVVYLLEKEDLKVNRLNSVKNKQIGSKKQDLQDRKSKVVEFILNNQCRYMKKDIENMFNIQHSTITDLIEEGLITQEMFITKEMIKKNRETAIREILENEPNTYTAKEISEILDINVSKVYNDTRRMNIRHLIK